MEYLKKVAEIGEPKLISPVKSSAFVDHVENEIDKDWFVKFMDIKRDQMVKLLDAERVFGIKSLVTLCTVKMACDIYAKDVEFIRGYMGVKNDFSKEEEKWVKEEVECALESM